MLRNLIVLMTICILVMTPSTYASEASSCALQVEISGSKYVALNCCRCKSGGSPCRCGRASGFTNCDPCTTSCTTGFRDEAEILTAAYSQSQRRLASTTREAEIMFVGRLTIDGISMDELGSPVLRTIVIKTPTGRLFSANVGSVGNYEVLVPTSEFAGRAHHTETVSLGVRTMGPDQRVFFIALLADI